MVCFCIGKTKDDDREPTQNQPSVPAPAPAPISVAPSVPVTNTNINVHSPQVAPQPKRHSVSFRNGNANMSVNGGQGLKPTRQLLDFLDSDYRSPLNDETASVHSLGTVSVARSTVSAASSVSCHTVRKAAIVGGVLDLRNRGFRKKKLSQAQMHQLCSSMSVMSSHIRVLLLGGTGIDNDALPVLLRWVVTAPSLRVLELAGCRLNSNSIITLFTNICQSSTCRIETINISHNSLDIATAQMVAKYLNLPSSSVTTLIAHNNPLTARGVASLAQCKKLQRLDCRNCFNPPPPTSYGFAELQTIEKDFRLQFNDLVNAVQANATLKELKLQGCNLEAQHHQALLAAVANNQALLNGGLQLTDTPKERSQARMESYQPLFQEVETVRPPDVHLDIPSAPVPPPYMNGGHMSGGHMSNLDPHTHNHPPTPPTTPYNYTNGGSPNKHSYASSSGSYHDAGGYSNNKQNYYDSDDDPPPPPEHLRNFPRHQVPNHDGPYNRTHHQPPRHPNHWNNGGHWNENENDPQLYHTLGLEPGASEKDIRKAYRRLAKQCHPDKNPNNERATEEFHRISRAYRQLLRESPQPEDDSDAHHSWRRDGRY